MIYDLRFTICSSRREEALTHPEEPGILDCGGKCSATPLWNERRRGEHRTRTTFESAVAAALCRRSPKFRSCRREESPPCEVRGTTKSTCRLGRSPAATSHTQRTDQIHVEDLNAGIRQGDDNRHFVRCQKDLFGMVHVNGTTIQMNGEPPKWCVLERRFKIFRLHGGILPQRHVKATPPNTLAAIGLALLLFEWWWYHRRTV